MFDFKLDSKANKSSARTGMFHTPHGTVRTPSLATVATEGKIRGLENQNTGKFPLDYVIVNTFHILTKNILEKITPSETVHDYGNFPGVVASDSGGFQVFSLGFGKVHQSGKLSAQHESDTVSEDKNNPLTITEEGVAFDWKTETDVNNIITLTPEKSMQIQDRIGADIKFAFDECTSPFNSYEYTAASVDKTHRWLERCVAAHKKLEAVKHHSSRLSQALFAVVQGGQWENLRVRSAQLCASADVTGFGIGGSFGSSFGDSKENMHKVLEWIIPHLPEEKPRHLLGIGQVDDLFESVERGVDLFDCVIPTREARHKIFYTKKGKLALKHIKTSKYPIAIDCKCIACTQKITGEQLYELYLKKDMRAFYYGTAHNIQFFSDLMSEIRVGLQNNTFAELKDMYLRYYHKK